MESIVDEILGKDTTESQQEAKKEMLRLSKPSVWNVYIHGNAELEHETGFENFLFTVSEHTNEDLDKMTVYRFYCLLDYIKGKNKNG